MHFMIAAFLKPGAEKELIKYHDEFNEHLGPAAEDVRIAGALRGPDGRRIGYMAIMSADDFGVAEAWLRESPFYQANLYERVDVFEYSVEVGNID